MIEVIITLKDTELHKEGEVSTKVVRVTTAGAFCPDIYAELGYQVKAKTGELLADHRFKKEKE